MSSVVAAATLGHLESVLQKERGSELLRNGVFSGEMRVLPTVHPLV